MRMIILAAGLGSRLSPLTDTKPKCLVELAGRPLLEWQIMAAKSVGITNITVIGGYMAEQLKQYDVTLLCNKDYATTNMVRTLFCADEYLTDGFIMSYGDIVYSGDVLQAVVDSDTDIGVVVDHNWLPYWQQRFDNPLDDAETLRLDTDDKIIEIGQKPSTTDEIEGQYIGLARFSESGVDILSETYKNANASESSGKLPFNGKRSMDQLYMTDLIQGIIDSGYSVNEIPIEGGWVEVDSISDLELAETLVRKNRISI